MAQRLRGDRRRVSAPSPSDPPRSFGRSAQPPVPPGPGGELRPVGPREQAWRHRRKVGKRNRLAIVVTLLVLAVAGGVVIGRMAWQRVGGGYDASAGGPAGSGESSESPAASRPSVVTATAGAAEIGPVRGAGTFTYATATGKVHGAAGPLRRFRVAVENGSGQDADRVRRRRRRGPRRPARLDGDRSAPAAAGRWPGARPSSRSSWPPRSRRRRCARPADCTPTSTRPAACPDKVIINLARWLTARAGLRGAAGGLPAVRDQPRGRARARARARGVPRRRAAGAGDACSRRSGCRAAWPTRGRTSTERYAGHPRDLRRRARIWAWGHVRTMCRPGDNG